MSRPEPAPSAGASRRQPEPLWPVAVLGFGVGDVSTTAVGLQVLGVVEMNPLVAGLPGGAALGAMVAVKLLVLGGCYLLWRRLPRAPATGIPLGLAALGLAVTVWNFHVVLRATTG